MINLVLKIKRFGGGRGGKLKREVERPAVLEIFGTRVWDWHRHTEVCGMLGIGTLRYVECLADRDLLYSTETPHNIPW